MSQRESPTSLGSPPTVQFDMSTTPTPTKQLLSPVSAMADFPEATTVASLSTAVAYAIPVAVSATELQANDLNAAE